MVAALKLAKLAMLSQWSKTAVAGAPITRLPILSMLAPAAKNVPDMALRTAALYLKGSSVTLH